MITINHRSSLVRSAVAAPVLVLMLAGCGGSSDSSSGTSSATSTAAASPGTGPVGGNPGGIDFTAIQNCLTAAGISVPTPSGGFPSGRPSGAPPSGAGGGAPNGTPPSGAPGGGFGGGQFDSPTVQAALKACGITLPTRGARPSVTPTAP